MSWPKAPIPSLGSLGPIHRNDAIAQSNDQTVAGWKTFSETKRIQAVLAGKRPNVLSRGAGSSQPAAVDAGARTLMPMVTSPSRTALLTREMNMQVGLEPDWSNAAD